MGQVYFINKYAKNWGDKMAKNKIGVISSKDVADYFLSRIDVQTGSVMTHLKLQKLCYYAQAWSLVFDDVPLFKGNFQAWAHGPVCVSLWKKFSQYSYHEIPAPLNFDKSIFSESQIETLDAVWDAYGQYDGRYLEDLSHQEMPWIKARNGIRSGVHCTSIINQDDMKKYYSQLLEQNEQEE